MYMIERRYGPGNRDYLYTYGPGDKSTCWVASQRAMIITGKEQARLMLEAVQEAARMWDNGDRFKFAVVRDRTGLPDYFGSTYINPYIEDDEPSCYPIGSERERFDCRH